MDNKPGEVRAGPCHWWVAGAGRRKLQCLERKEMRRKQHILGKVPTQGKGEVRGREEGRAKRADLGGMERSWVVPQGRKVLFRLRESIPVSSVPVCGLPSLCRGELDPRRGGRCWSMQEPQSQRLPSPGPRGALFHPFPLAGIDLRLRADPGPPPAMRGSTFQTRLPAPQRTDLSCASQRHGDDGDVGLCLQR